MSIAYANDSNSADERVNLRACSPSKHSLRSPVSKNTFVQHSTDSWYCRLNRHVVVENRRSRVFGVLFESACDSRRSRTRCEACSCSREAPCSCASQNHFRCSNGLCVAGNGSLQCARGHLSAQSSSGIVRTQVSTPFPHQVSRKYYNL